jgi:outer membrane protein OmpA-like peptidoglycan-associated protein
MSGVRVGIAVTALGLCLGVPACSSPPQRDIGNDVGNDVGTADPIVPSPVAPGNESAAPAKSILRPEVAEPVPEEPSLRPIDAVLGFDEEGKGLTDEAKAMLDELAAGPAVQAGGAITLRGHSDSRGSDSANLRASRRRAEVVRDYLAAKGIDPARMTVIALGETTPLVPNALPDGRDDPAARARNRRVELHVALPATAPAEGDTPVDTGGQPEGQNAEG